MGIILGNASIITVDKERRIIIDGAIAFDGDIIRGIGKTEEIKDQFSDFDYHNMSQHIIMPGLINAHVHLTQALIKGCADDCSLIDFLADRIWQLMGRYSEDQALVSTELCILEMIKSGTTSFVETLLLSRYGLDGITQAVIDSGMRGVLAKSVMDISTYASRESIMYEGMVEDGEECLKQAIEWKEKSENAGNGRVNIWLGPRPVGSTTDTMLKKVADTAELYDMGIAIHFCEVTQDVDHIKKKYNMTPGEFGESTGIFTDRTLLAHGIWLEETDMAAIRRNGTTVVHCPASNANLASGFCKVPELLEAGVNVALATDGATCDNSTDMFDAMRLAAIIHKNRTLDPLVVPAETAIELATINGAKAIKKDHLIGSLEVGKKADIITIDCKNPRLVPNTNPVSTVVYSARGDDVDNVIIDGEFVVKNREILTMDEQNILDKANKTIVKVLEQAGKENKSKWKTL